MYKKTTVAIATLDASSLPPVDKSSLVALLPDGVLPPHITVGLCPVLPDPAMPRYTHTHSFIARQSFPRTSCSILCRRRNPAEAGRVAETILCGTDHVTELPFEPSFIRPLPPLYTCDSEVSYPQ